MDALYKIFSSLGFSRWALIVVLIGVFIDINPTIKFNPIKAIFKYLGKAFNSSMEQELFELRSDMTSKIQDLQNEQISQREALDRLILDSQNKEIHRLRWEIIDFDNGIMNEVKHSREQYRHVLDTLEKYNNIISEIGISMDEYYRNVQEHGDSIRKHYDEHKDSNELFF